METQSPEDQVNRVLASWAEMSGLRYRVTERTGPFYRLPVVKSKWKLLAREMAPGVRVLDIGAGERLFADRLKERFPGLIYESMDVDRSRTHDYYALDEVRGPYDRILLFDVIEHLPLEEGVRLLSGARALLRPGGRLIVTVPNTFNAPACLWDVTHLAHYSFAELGGLLLAVGFGFPRICRVHEDKLRRRIARALLHPLLKMLQIDPARHIAAVAEKPRDADH